ncbi:MAG: GspH/FimT family pseudopilin [Arenimonas sp.]
MNAQRGVTLIELMMVVAVLALLFGAAVPAVSGGLEAARAGQARASLLASLTAASGRAAITGTRGVLCPSSDGASCLDSPDWSGGWLVFLDNNGSRDLEGGERVVRVQPPLAGKVHLRSTVGRTRIVFQGNGGNAGSNVTFTLCDGRGPSRARALIMSNIGRLRDGPPSATGIAATCPQ